MSEDPGGEGTGGPRDGGEGGDGGRLLAGRYRLGTELGRGGMGVVWRARDELLAREVAVKEVRAPRELTEGEQALLYARLEREGRAAARIAHRNVVTVYDVVSEEGRPWIVMELVRGLSLAETLDADGPLTPARAAGIGSQVLAALRVAHTAGVLHRDVKPGNVLLGNDGRVVLTDFGIARVTGSSTLTLTGELVGSPEFLAPERALGEQAGPESDLWSLGVTLYAAVEGHSPFRQDTPLTTLRAVVDEQLPPPRRAGPLAPVLEGLLRKDPRERLDGAEAQRMLDEIAAGGGATPTVVVPPPSYVPTVAAGHAVPGYGPPTPVPGPETTAGGPSADTAAEAERKRRRSVRLLLAGALIAALAAGGVAYALLADDGSRGPTPGSTSGGGGGSGGGTGDGGGGGTGGGGGGGTPGRTSPGSTPSASTSPGGTDPGRTYPNSTPPHRTYPRTTPPRSTARPPTTSPPTTSAPTSSAPTTAPTTSGSGATNGGATGATGDGGTHTYGEVPPGGGTSSGAGQARDQVAEFRTGK
ncbi:serine/threonine protein kinase [Streptomyces albofaciens JCM 4342]|uniref:serine/threonine-protein kinase n=1 Tax=Streptomyces albofaciens TaxID=66866 RepID=UPI00123ACE17|nr:serine/threonine-protein kinase [Streptomyces albofaciens]KAA6222769.1 serine/threonine protein kinase [Streptomyces albofaciens JCM 4342]